MIKKWLLLLAQCLYLKILPIVCSNIFVHMNEYLDLEKACVSHTVLSEYLYNFLKDGFYMTSTWFAGLLNILLHS